MQMKLIDKDALVAEIRRWLGEIDKGFPNEHNLGRFDAYKRALLFIESLEVVDPYEQCIQYASIESGIKAHAEEYSFNIESELFNQLTKEQQTLWRKEIEQAVISGGYNGLDLARDPRYKENLEVKEVDLDVEIAKWEESFKHCPASMGYKETAKHFFELGLKARKDRMI